MERAIDPENYLKPTGPTDPAFYKDLLDRMSDGVYFVDRERRILYWNQGATGIRRADRLMYRSKENGRRRATIE